MGYREFIKDQSDLAAEHGDEGEKPIVFCIKILEIGDWDPELIFFHLVLLKYLKNKIIFLQDFESRPKLFDILELESRLF